MRLTASVYMMMHTPKEHSIGLVCLGSCSTSSFRSCLGDTGGMYLALFGFSLSTVGRVTDLCAFSPVWCAIHGTVGGSMHRTVALSKRAASSFAAFGPSALCTSAPM